MFCTFTARYVSSMSSSSDSWLAIALIAEPGGTRRKRSNLLTNNLLTNNLPYIHTYMHTYIHTYIHTLLSFHTPSCFVTHPLSHSTLSHTTVLTSRSFTTSFVFPSFPVPATTFEAHYWKKLTCGVIRSFNFADIWDHPPKTAGPPELFWKFCFPFRDCFGVCSFSLQCAAFWSWKLPFQRYCNILEFEPLIFHGLCSTLVLKLLMLDDILRLGAI